MREGEQERWILHADMDAFYASVEQRDHPEYLGRPVVVGGLGRRGVVAAASYEARKFGVRSAMPGFQARELCPHAVFVSPNMARYSEVSAQVAAVFAEFTPLVEPLALDEAFLDISGSVRLFGGPLALAQRLKARIFEAVSLRVSVGVAPNKLVAKIACTLSKPDGLLVVARDAVNWLLDPLPVRRLWGVGPALGEELRQLGIGTFSELAGFDAYALRKALGNRAPLLQQLARGEDVRSVEPAREPQSIGEENTFGVDVSDAQTVFDTLTAHAHRVAQRLRQSGYRGKTISLKIKLSRTRGQRESRLSQKKEPVYPLLTRSCSIDPPTHEAAVIARTVQDLWRQARITEPIRLLGVSVSNLRAVSNEQLGLFGEARGDTLGRALDAINNRFGKQTIGPGVGTAQKSGISGRKLGI